MTADVLHLLFVCLKCVLVKAVLCHPGDERSFSYDLCHSSQSFSSSTAQDRVWVVQRSHHQCQSRLPHLLWTEAALVFSQTLFTQQKRGIKMKSSQALFDLVGLMSDVQDCRACDGRESMRSLCLQTKVCVKLIRCCTDRSGNDVKVQTASYAFKKLSWNFDVGHNDVDADWSAQR